MHMLYRFSLLLALSGCSNVPCSLPEEAYQNAPYFSFCSQKNCSGQIFFNKNSFEKNNLIIDCQQNITNDLYEVYLSLPEKNQSETSYYRYMFLKKSFRFKKRQNKNNCFVSFNQFELKEIQELDVFLAESILKDKNFIDILPNKYSTQKQELKSAYKTYLDTKKSTNQKRLPVSSCLD